MIHERNKCNKIHYQLNKEIQDEKNVTNLVLLLIKEAFEKKHSTTATTAHLLDDIYMNINNHEIKYAVFIDFRKAFDSVNHDIIIKKRLGLHPNTISWFKSDLASPTQITCANQVYSDIAPTTCGVPRGSVLGPLLFLVFIDDLGSVVQESSYKLYTDDAVI